MMTFRTLLSLMTTADKVLLWILVLSSLGSFAAVDWVNETGQIAVISYGDNSRLKKPLQQNEILTVTGALGPTRIEIANRTIRVIDSACPQKLCVHQGKISKVGEILVCAPNKVAIWLEAKRVNKFDAITG